MDTAYAYGQTAKDVVTSGRNPNENYDQDINCKNADAKKKTEKDRELHKCPNCIKVEERLNCASEDIIKQMTDELDKRNRIIKYLTRKNIDLLFMNEKQRERSDKITKKMADVFETKGDLENLADEFSNTKLSRRFEKDIFDKRWVSLFEWYIDHSNMDELKVIEFLSKLLQECYEMVLKKADDEMRHLLSLGENDAMPAACEFVDMHKCRRLRGQSKNERERITQAIAGKLLTSVDEEYREKEKGDLLKAFFKEYADCCWLMTISHPQLVIIFNVVGMPHANKLIERFCKYTTQETVIDKTKCKGTIVQVVWPSVTTKDDSLVYAKGSVVTVDGCKVETTIE